MAGGQCHSSGGCATGSERSGTLPPLLGGGVQGLGVGGVQPAGGEEEGELGMGGRGGSKAAVDGGGTSAKSISVGAN